MFVHISMFFLTFFIQLGYTVSLDDLNLILVQSIWRHGDRTPQSSFKNDVIKAEDWNSVGATITEDEKTGVITTKGIKQHFELGKEIRKRYIEETFNLLPKQKNDAFKNIFIQSTNRKRTILSAMSNVFGMYSDNDQLPKDFSQDWYLKSEQIPIYISEDYLNDCVGNIQCKCPRRSELQKIAHRLPEYQKYTNSAEFVELTTNLTKWTGQDINPDNFWKVVDTLHCERIHFMDRIVKKYDWYSDELFGKMTRANYKFNKFTSGIYEKQSEFDVGHEIKKIRIGPITNELYDRMADKIKCIDNPRCTNSFIQNLKYYAYSAHDMTIYSVLNAFGIDKYAGNEDGEWPDYAAALLIELFVDKKNNPYFRVVYKFNEESSFQTLTQFISDCDQQEFCPLSVFKNTAYFHKLENGKDIKSYCQELPSIPSRLTASKSSLRSNKYLSSSTKTTKSIDLPVILLSAMAILINGFFF